MVGGVHVSSVFRLGAGSCRGCGNDSGCAADEAHHFIPVREHSGPNPDLFASRSFEERTMSLSSRS